MIVAVDEAIPYAESAFAGTAEIRTFPGRKVSAADLKDAEALVVRSITQVDRSLLDGTCVRFVGTATIGMDHLDDPYLRSRGIHVTNAAGSNANSVSEYITAALLVTAERKGWELRRKSIAIVGVGHVGTRVEIKARALGMDVVLCDPPLLESTGDRKYRFLKDVLDADIVTLHTPLTREGPYPTYHMMDERVIGRLQPHQLLINSARGPVVAGPALKEALLRKALAGAVLDVWEG
jgi:erythronate-4-phosphate dehydrogenase